MKNTFSIYLLSAVLFLTVSCDMLNSSENDKENIISTKIEESLNNDPQNYDACLQIIDEYQDSLQNSELDSALSKAVLKKITDMEVRFNLEGSNVKFKGPLGKCVLVNSAEISFKEYEESWTERNLMKITSSNAYPLIEINIKCRVIDRVPNNLYRNSFKPEVTVKGFSNGKDFEKFKLKDENIADFIGPNTYYEMDKEKERNIKLRFKLWDEGVAKDEGKAITDRTRKVFNTLNVLKNTNNLNIELNLYDIEINEGGGGEVIHTGPRGGRYVIRNGGKRYVK